MTTIKQKQTPIAVLGAGAWGTALALLLVRNGNSVRLWSNEPAQVKLMRETKANPEFLPGFSLPPDLQIEDDLASALDQVQDILIAVPSQVFTDVLYRIQSIRKNEWRVIWGTK